MTRGVAILIVLVASACASDGGSVANSFHDASANTGGAAGAAPDAGATEGGGTDGGWPGGSGGAPEAGTAGASGGGGTAAAGSGGTGGTAGSGAGCGAAPSQQCSTGGACPRGFPQGVPESDFIANACTYGDTDKSVDDAVNAVMASLSGCSVGSDCTITGFAGTTTDEVCQSWFSAVTAALRAQGYCAGQHIVGVTDEIAVNSSCCEDKWYGYHICNYGGPKVVWNPGARRGWWMVDASYCQ